MTTKNALGNISKKPHLGSRINWSHPLTQGIIGCWLLPFSSSSPPTSFKLLNSYGYGRDGVLKGFTLQRGTRDSMGLTFTPPQYVDVTDLPEASAYTLEAWIKCTGTSPDTTSGYRIIDISRSGTSTKINIMQRVSSAEFSWFNSTPARVELIGTSAINDNNWHQIICTTDGTTFELYIDRILEGVNTSSSLTTLKSTATDSLGSDGNHTSNFPGSIAIARVWNRKLCNNEITNLFINPYSMFNI